MARTDTHIPVIKTIHEFFRMYGLGEPLYPDIMCMKLEDQPDDKLIHVPLYRANFFRVIHFTNAQLHFAAIENKHEVTSNCLCFTYPGKMESWTRSGKLYGFVIYFTASFASLDITAKNFDIDYPYFNFEAEPVLSLTDEEASEIKLFEEEMMKEIYSDAQDQLDMVSKLLHLYLHRIRRIYTSKMSKLSPEIKASKVLYNRFRSGLDEYMQLLYAEKKSAMPTVSLIAAELFINPNYLNGIVKNLTGKTASAHIREKLLLEAKSFLLHTDLKVSEIAFKLGFENNSYFNRFFKKNASVSPVEYRNRFVKK